MSEEGALLKTDELGTNYGDLFNPDEEAVEPKSQESKIGRASCRERV